MSQSSSKSGIGGTNFSPIYFQAYLTTPFNLPAGTAAVIPFNSPKVNVGSAFNGSNGIFTAPADGFYRFVATIFNFNLNLLTGNTEVAIAYTGSLQSMKITNYARTSVSGGTFVLTASWNIQMIANETTSVQSFANGTGTYQIYGQPGPNPSLQWSDSTWAGWRIA